MSLPTQLDFPAYSISNVYQQKARYLAGDNLRALWREFSTLSKTVLQNSNTIAQHKCSLFLS